ncbi:MAG TPA: HEPN domain-containing protein [Candidatus Hydrogenedentes bacterium]|nr:HEPN domain-containing protein [Candidatus Hydrogenedentota bacterium]HNT86440.1 HEPN domain-containing protein [Candidatus Hydrogenedentota bacterium]
MAACDEARQLIQAAKKDWRALGAMTDPEVFADEIFGFHAQQLIEKALKAWLCLLDIEYPHTHDISLLLRLIAERGCSVEPLLDLIAFNPYAVQYRYDAFDEMGETFDRDAAIARVGEVLGMIEGMIADK